MGLARAANLPVVVVGDIDRGGVLAHLFGTVAVLSPEDQGLIAGFIINKFRGDPALLAPGLDQLGALTGRPTYGVLPYSEELWLDAEDSLSVVAGAIVGVPIPPHGDQVLRVGVIRLPRISNSTDIEALACEPGVLVRWVSEPSDVADADLVVDPGLTLGPSGGATDCDESRRGTAAGTSGSPLSGNALDLDAPTQDLARGETTPPAAAVIPGNRTGEITSDDPTMPMPTTPAPARGIASAPTGLPKRATVPAHDGGQAPASRTTRFTTVEELERASRAEAAARDRRDLVIRGIAAVGLLAMVAGVGYTLLRPPTADELHARIRAIADDASADLRDARPLIEQFLAEHAADPRAAGVRGLDRELDLDSLEKRARRRRDDADPALTPLEREYRSAMAREDESPLACAAALAAILALHADEATAPPAADAAPESQPGLWLDLVRRQLARVEPLADREREQDVDRAAETLAEAADLAADAAVATDAAARDALLSRRRTLLSGVVEIYASRTHVAAAVAEARRLLSTPESTP
jgi:hypothetical protein